MIGSLQQNSQPNLWSLSTNTDKTLSLFRQELSKGNSVEHFITSAVPETQDILLFAQKATWEILNRFNIETARLHMVLTAHAFKQPLPWAGEFRLFGTSLIKELNWHKRTNISRSEKLDRIAHSAWLLSSLAVKLIWNEAPPNCGIDHTRMWHVPLIREYGETNLEGEIEEPQNLVLAVKPGAWANHLYNKHAANQFDWICKEIMKIDTRYSELPLRLAIYLFMDRPMNPKGEYRLRHLLKEVLPQVYVDKFQGDRRRTQEFRRQLNMAFAALEQLGWKVEGYGEQPRFENLMASWIVIQPPANKSYKTDPKISQFDEIRQSRPEFITGAEIREFRKSNNWSQNEFATLLGVSQELVSKMERGTCGINRSLEQMIRDWRDIYLDEKIAKDEAIAEAISNADETDEEPKESIEAKIETVKEDE
jgi:transcriptional regulator with XRE-family HTH domain